MQKQFCLVVQILLILGVCVISINAQDSEISLSPVSKESHEQHILENIQVVQTKVLQNIQKQVDLLKENLVNIVSHEESLSERGGTYDSAGPNRKDNIQTKSILSEYRVSYNGATVINPDCGIVAKILNPVEHPYVLQEERNLLSEKITVNNAKVTTWHSYTQLEQFYLGIARNSFVELIIPFDKQYEKCFEYKLLGVTKIKDRDVYIMEVMGKEKSRVEGIAAKSKPDEVNKKPESLTSVEAGFIKGDAEKEKNRRLTNYDAWSGLEDELSWDIKFGGLALIDAQTMEIFQFNGKWINMEITQSAAHVDNVAYKKYPAKFPNGPGFIITNGKTSVNVLANGIVNYNNDLFNAYSFIVQTEYDKIKIADQFVTMPVTRMIRVYQRRIDLETYKFTDEADWRETYTTRYSDYKVFNVETNINFEWR